MVWQQCYDVMKDSAEKCLGVKQHTKMRLGKILSSKREEESASEKEKSSRFILISDVQKAHSMNESRKFYKGINNAKKSDESDDGKGFDAPSLDEIAAAISGLKNNKAPGLDYLLSYLMLVVSFNLIRFISRL